MYLLLQPRKPDSDRDQNKVQKGQMETEKDGNLSKVNYIDFDHYRAYINLHVI